MATTGGTKLGGDEFNEEFDKMLVGRVFMLHSKSDPVRKVPFLGKLLGHITFIKLGFRCATVYTDSLTHIFQCLFLKVYWTLVVNTRMSPDSVVIGFDIPKHRPFRLFSRFTVKAVNMFCFERMKEALTNHIIIAISI